MGSVDLLPQLRESAGITNVDQVAVNFETANEEADDALGLNAFYDIVSQVNQQIQHMKQMTTELNAAHNELHCATSDADKKHLRTQASDFHEKIGAESTGIKVNLDKMQQFTEEAKKSEDQHPSEVRIQENHYMLARQEFIAALTEFQQVEQQNKEKYKETIKRRIKTKFSHQQLADEQVERMATEVIDKGAESKMFTSSQDMRALSALEDVVQMRNDIHKIEVALKQLHQMFLDMAVLVAEQGELLNDIRDNVDKATTYVYRGRLQVQEARNYQKKSRRRMCYLFVCVVVVVVVALAIGLGIAS
eukprot:TRINITY_DN29848_c0_g1_i1.p1 TRINITY_DN29848_c0_g1~~TRINITY_DN29848_c0_g1_i1.p1  ORF type:complete len:305 (+),score=111.79 TRINITY_DN29848_c0_g1_i1:57-971(+)